MENDEFTLATDKEVEEALKKYNDYVKSLIIETPSIENIVGKFSGEKTLANLLVVLHAKYTENLERRINNG